MTAFDYGVLLIIGFSVLLSVMRGAVREVLALISWVVAFMVANIYGSRLALYLPNAIPNESLKLLAAYIVLFLVTLLLMSLITIALSELIKKIGLGIMDRILGGVFGLVRGYLIVTTLVLLAGLTALPHHPAWQNAVLSSPLEATVAYITPWLPADFAKRIKYE